jgi:hypothetical protein
MEALSQDKTASGDYPQYLYNLGDLVLQTQRHLSTDVSNHPSYGPFYYQNKINDIEKNITGVPGLMDILNLIYGGFLVSPMAGYEQREGINAVANAQKDALAMAAASRLADFQHFKETGNKMYLGADQMESPYTAYYRMAPS